MEKKKHATIQVLAENAFLNFYHMDAYAESGKPFDYYFSSRRKKEELRIRKAGTKHMARQSMTYVFYYITLVILSSHAKLNR